MAPQRTWRKSSYSGGQGGNNDCVEVGFSLAAVGVRDSKAPDTAELAFAPTVWRAFLTAAR